MPEWRSPAAPDQSIAAKWRKRSGLTPLAPFPVPPLEPLQHLALEPALDRAVVLLRRHPLGPVIRPGKPVFRLVVIGIALAIADVLHQLRRGVEDAGGGREGAGLPRRFPRRLLGDI